MRRIIYGVMIALLSYFMIVIQGATSHFKLVNGQ